MPALVVSTVVFFAAGYLAKRQLEGMGIPKGPTRGIVVFCIAALLAYGAAALVGWLFP